MVADRFELSCPKCGRKGFAWARPVCQYCGHAIDAAELPDLGAARERLDAVYREAEKALEEVLEEKRRRRRAEEDIRGSGSGPDPGDLGTA